MGDVSCDHEFIPQGGGGDAMCFKCGAKTAIAEEATRGEEPNIQPQLFFQTRYIHMTWGSTLYMLALWLIGVLVGVTCTLAFLR